MNRLVGSVRLSGLTNVVPIAIVRDGEFSSLGLLSHNADNMLVVLYDPDYVPRLTTNGHIACVITSRHLASQIPPHLAVAVCEDPTTVFYTIHLHLCTTTTFYWQDFASEVSPDARIHERAYIAPNSVRVGPGTLVEANASVLERSIIGEGVVIRAGAVIAGEGFEPKVIGGKHIVVPHAGGVRLRDRVEIQALTHVARAVFNGFTEVAEDTKIDALVHVAHNVRIGRRCEIAAGATISGSTVIGDDVWIGPGACISSEVRIGDASFVSLGAVVTRDVPPRTRVSGNFAIEHSRFVAFMRSIR